MLIVRDPTTVSGEDRYSHAAIGNFDGVHRGHQAVLRAAAGAAEKLGGKLSVVTFEPHPREFFNCELHHFRLTPQHVKQRRLQQLGVELLFVFRFDAALAQMSAEQFAGEILGSRLQLASIAAGSDFHFGHQRRGNVATLRAAGDAAGFAVHEVTPAGTTGTAYSSSAIRAALQAGDPVTAARHLGFWHSIEGEVIVGARRGRQLGMPTANIGLDGICQPAFGVYAVTVTVIEGTHAGKYHGVANLGVSPMFAGRAPRLEVHLFDFAGELYGAQIAVGLCAFLRPEAQFDSMSELAQQMQADATTARERIASLPTPWQE